MRLLYQVCFLALPGAACSLPAIVGMSFGLSVLIYAAQLLLTEKSPAKALLAATQLFDSARQYTRSSPCYRAQYTAAVLVMTSSPVACCFAS